MKPQALLLTCIFLAISIPFLGQQLSSEKLKGTQKREVFEKVSAIGNSAGYYFVKNNHSSGTSFDMSVNLVKGDNQMNAITTVKLFSTSDYIGPLGAFFERIDGKEKLIYYKRPGKSEIIEMYVADINTTGTGIENAQKILELPEKTHISLYEAQVYNKFKLFIMKSPDKEKTLFLWNSGTNNQYTYSVTDKDLKVFRTKTRDLPYSMKVSSVCIDNEGTVFASFYHFENKRKVWTVARESVDDNMKESIVEMNDVTPVDAYISQVSEGKIKVCGTYTTNGNNISGAFMQTLDVKTVTFKNPVKTPLPAKLMDGYIKGQYSKKDETNRGLEPIINFKQLVMDDETVCLSGEVIRVGYEHPYQSSPGTRLKVFWSGNILNIVFRQDAILFVNVSRTEARTDEFNEGENFFPFVYDNKVILLYQSRRPDVDESFASLMEELPKNKVHFLFSAISKDGQSIPGIIKGDDVSYILDYERFKYDGQLPLLILCHKAKGLGMKEEVGFYRVNIK